MCPPACAPRLRRRAPPLSAAPARGCTDRAPSARSPDGGQVARGGTNRPPGLPPRQAPPAARPAAEGPAQGCPSRPPAWPAGCPGLFVHPPVRAELVVLLPLLRIPEHLVGFVDLLELRLGRLVRRVHVRVMLAREL